MLAGAKSLAAITEWAADAPAAVLTALGGPSREPTGPTAPAEATVRRILQRVDGDALDAAIGAWLAARDPDRPSPNHDLGRRARRSLAVDGKTVRGARRADGTQVHLLAAMTRTGLVAAQREVGAKTNEITVFRPMLADLDLADTVVTFDALHSQTAHARFLVAEKKAHYIAVIKGNQLLLLHQHLKQLPWREVPLLDKTRATEHGRDEIRRVKTCTVTRGLDFPHADQAVQIVRRRRTVTTRKVTLERVYAVTDLTAEQADAPEIAHRVREHWGIENKIHHVRDTTFAEDASRVRTGTAPPAMEGGSRDERTRNGWYYWGMQEETARSAIDTFISAFNASDDSYVTALLSQALTSDVVFWGPLGRSEGIAAVERFVLDIRRHPAGTGTMVRCSAVDMPDEWARYQWVFTTPDGGPRLTGTDVVHLRRSLIDQVIVFAGEIEPSAS